MNTLCACLLTGFLTAEPPRRPIADATVHYRLTYIADPEPGRLEIEVSAEGFDRREREVVAFLQNWGEWTEVEGYLEGLEAEPPLQQPGQAERMRFDLPRRWNGSLELRYSIALNRHGDDVHRRHGLLPWRLGELGAGFAHNTLPVIYQGGEPVDARRTVEFHAPENMTIATGWGGLSLGEQQLELDHDIDQCMLFFGEPLAVRESEENGISIQVVQFGDVNDITETLATMMEKLVPLYTESTAHDLGKPFRAFVTGIDPHGGGGIRTDHGIGVGYTENADSPYYLHTIAHEMFHEWLPGALPPLQAKVVWFFEGFTDYLSLWHLVRAEVISADWFAERLQELDRDARSSERFGKVSYADPVLQWRDGDGPMETLAYKGGALLAFHLDAALYESGGPPLVRLIADLIEEQGGYSLPTLRDWCESHGVESWFDHYVEAGEPVPPLSEVLPHIGFPARETDVPMTYFGVELKSGGLTGEVISIDPEGPNLTKENLRVGDVIVDSGPRRTDGATLKDGVSAAHPFGLVDFEVLHSIDWWVEVERDGERQRIAIEAWLSPGARGFEHRAPDGVELEFFTLER